MFHHIRSQWNNGCCHSIRFQPFGCLNAIHLRHLHIHQNQVKSTLLYRLYGLNPIIGQRHPQSNILQHTLHQLLHLRCILGIEHLSLKRNFIGKLLILDLLHTRIRLLYSLRILTQGMSKLIDLLQHKRLVQIEDSILQLPVDPIQCMVTISRHKDDTDLWIELTQALGCLQPVNSWWHTHIDKGHWKTAPHTQCIPHQIHPQLPLKRRLQFKGEPLPLLWLQRTVQTTIQFIEQTADISRNSSYIKY